MYTEMTVDIFWCVEWIEPSGVMQHYTSGNTSSTKTAAQVASRFLVPCGSHLYPPKLEAGVGDPPWDASLGIVLVEGGRFVLEDPLQVVDGSDALLHCT